MPRRLLALLVAALLPSLSFGVLSGTPPELPAVSAPPPLRQALAHDAAAEARAARIEKILRARNTGLSPAENAELARVIVDEARRHQIDPALVLAVMHVESRFDTFAVSPVGALGLMQLLPSTAAEMAAREDVPWEGPRTLFDPVANVKLGVAYLRELLDRYGEVRVALAAYNWGPGHIDRRIQRGNALPTEYPNLVLEARVAPQGDSRS
jgi:soluble lytic murein transglycosylase-like protein